MRHIAGCIRRALRDGAALGHRVWVHSDLDPGLYGNAGDRNMHSDRRTMGVCRVSYMAALSLGAIMIPKTLHGWCVFAAFLAMTVAAGALC
jgi:hypothetical protein